MNKSRKRYLLDEYWFAPDERLLSRSGKPIHLPKKPFEVLAYLVENRDRFVGRTELLDRFWDGKDVYDDALRKCVGKIRKAFDDQSGEPHFIETRWGVGYRYIGPTEEQVYREETSITEIERTRGVRIIVEEEIENGADENSKVNQRVDVARSLLATASQRRTITGAALILLIVAIGAGAFIARRLTSVNSPAPLRSIAI